MTLLQDFKARICLTAAGCLIHQGKVLLVKHKKLGIWLNPGGHIEADELPHQAAEREFWEETGIKVKAYDPHMPTEASGQSEYVPNPYLSNLHWVSQENYEHRVNNAQLSEKTARDWKKGCEQHVSFVYLVKPVTENVEFKKNIEETDGIAWFSPTELVDIDVSPNVSFEVQRAFELVKA